MKANEMPERVYLFDYNDAMVTPIEGDTVYVREDAFIEKAIKFFAPHIQDNSGGYDRANVIENFRKYMKEEPVSEEQVKESAEIQHVSRTCKKNGNSLTQEPVSEDLDLGCGVIWKGEKPVSDDLEKAAEHDVCEVVNCCSATGIPNDHIPSWVQDAMINEFIHGAKWQKEHFWKPADGDDLPEIDREVIAIIDYDFGHYKVVYAHRPNPDGWNGTNIDTEEKEHFEPVIYDKGGWNQPHVLYWLDAELPYEENKIETINER